MEELLSKLNSKHGELLQAMEEAQVSTFVDKGNYLIKNKTLFKESYLNGRKELSRVLVFTKIDFESKINSLLDQIEARINYYHKIQNRQSK